MTIPLLSIWLSWALIAQILGFDYSSWQFWTITGLLWASNAIGELRGRDRALLDIVEEINTNN